MPKKSMFTDWSEARQVRKHLTPEQRREAVAYTAQAIALACSSPHAQCANATASALTALTGVNAVVDSNDMRKINEDTSDHVLRLLCAVPPRLVSRSWRLSTLSALGDLRECLTLMTKGGRVPVGLGIRRPRRSHSKSGQVRCPICAPLRCSKAK